MNSKEKAGGSESLETLLIQQTRLQLEILNHVRSKEMNRSDVESISDADRAASSLSSRTCEVSPTSYVYESMKILSSVADNEIQHPNAWSSRIIMEVYIKA